jgi:hypothetical protein
MMDASDVHGMEVKNKQERKEMKKTSEFLTAVALTLRMKLLAVPAALERSVK